MRGMPKRLRRKNDGIFKDIMFDESLEYEK
jgi:hypothetical protein